MSDHRITRRDFLCDSAAAAAGTALALAAPSIVRAGNPTGADTSKIHNYTSEMEYRRCGAQRPAAGGGLTRPVAELLLAARAGEC